MFMYRLSYRQLSAASWMNRYISFSIKTGVPTRESSGHGCAPRLPKVQVHRITRAHKPCNAMARRTSRSTQRCQRSQLTGTRLASRPDMTVGIATSSARRTHISSLAHVRSHATRSRGSVFMVESLRSPLRHLGASRLPHAGALLGLLAYTVQSRA